MRELTINKNDAGQRLDKFLQKSLNDLPKSLMYKYIRNKKIKVNGKRCTFDQQLETGDVVLFHIAESFFESTANVEFLKMHGKIDVVYEDENIVVMNKPKGLLSQSDVHSQEENLADQFKLYLYKNHQYDYKNERSFSPALCHRLDKNTQGLVIGAKNAPSLRRINEMIRDREINKFYLAIVEGKMDDKKKELIMYHHREGQKIDISTVMKKGYQKTVTAYETIDYQDGYSLLKIKLDTGKMHQIRAVFSFLGHPLLGDFKYGAKQSDFKYQALIAYRIEFHNQKDDDLSYLQDKVIELDCLELKKQFYAL